MLIKSAFTIKLIWEEQRFFLSNDHSRENYFYPRNYNCHVSDKLVIVKMGEQVLQGYSSRCSFQTIRSFETTGM